MVVYIILASLAVYQPSIGLSQESQVDKVLVAILQDWQSIHPGDSQARLEELFDQDGGLSAIIEKTYVSRRCPYVKVDVKFRKVGTGTGLHATLIVESLSKLYVDYPHNG
jgi:hypothetical protein